MHVVKYMKYTEQFKLVFGARRKAKPVGLYGLPSAPSFPALAYGDADYANCVEMRRSVTGIVITLDGTPVVWVSRKQPKVTNSSTAAEYVAASMTADEAILVQKILSDLVKPQKPIPLLCENTAAKCLLKNPIENGKTKYLDVHWHYCRELFADGKLVVCRAESNSQLTDVCTKMHSDPKMASFRYSRCLL
jgi:hypothetical protein